MVLPSGGVKHIRVSWVHFDIADAGPFTTTQGFFPGLTAIGGHEKTALPALGPQWPLYSNPHGVGVIGMNQNC